MRREKDALATADHQSAAGRHGGYAGVSLLPAGGVGARGLRGQRRPGTSVRQTGEGRVFRYLRVGLSA